MNSERQTAYVDTPINRDIIACINRLDTSLTGFMRATGTSALSSVLNGTARLGRKVFERLDAFVKFGEAARLQMEQDTIAWRRERQEVARGVMLVAQAIQAEPYPCDGCPRAQVCKARSLACKAFYDYTLTSEPQQGEDWTMSPKAPSAEWYARIFSDDEAPDPRTRDRKPTAASPLVHWPAQVAA